MENIADLIEELILEVVEDEEYRSPRRISELKEKINVLINKEN